MYVVCNPDSSDDRSRYIRTTPPLLSEGPWTPGVSSYIPNRSYIFDNESMIKFWKFGPNDVGYTKKDGGLQPPHNKAELLWRVGPPFSRLQLTRRATISRLSLSTDFKYDVLTSIRFSSIINKVPPPALPNVDVWEPLYELENISTESILLILKDNLECPFEHHSLYDFKY